MNKQLFVALVFSACGGAVTSGAATDLQRLEVLDVDCGAQASSCQHLDSRIVDFDAGRLEHHACVEGVDGGSPKWGPSRGDAVDSHALTAAQLATVRDAVWRLQVSQARIQAFDGAMTSVEVTSASKGTQSLSPGAACGVDPYQQIVVGFPELQTLVNGL
jgi:hypothetical protein